MSLQWRRNQTGPSLRPGAAARERFLLSLARDAQASAVGLIGLKGSTEGPTGCRKMTENPMRRRD